MLTGEREVGKTHLCQRVVEEAKERGFTCAGVISLAVFESEHKVGITLVDVGTGEERPLASADDLGGDVRWGRYSFVPASLAWGAEILTGATPCDLLVIDELGPLELELGRGLVKAVDVLVRGGFSLAIAVVRPALLGKLRERLGGRQTDVVEVTPLNRDQLPPRLVSMLEEERD